LQYFNQPPTGATGAGITSTSPYFLQGGPRGVAGPIANTVFFPPIVDPGIPGAIWWNVALGNTGLSRSPGPGHKYMGGSPGVVVQ
jgi:hypothetical protein